MLKFALAIAATVWAAGWMGNALTLGIEHKSISKFFIGIKCMIGIPGILAVTVVPLALLWRWALA